MNKYNIETELVPIEKIFSVKGGIEYRSILHYTSILTVLKIFRNKTFLFNRIDCVNDLEEQKKLREYENYRRTFISCFTYEEKESIPMWKIYTKDNMGVLLKIDFNDGYQLEDLFYATTMQTKDNIRYPININNSLVKESPWWIKLDCFCVDYTDTPNNNPILGEYSIPDYFGREKGTAWYYEKELRFRAVMHPKINETIEEIPQVDYLFANINFEAINKITLTFNPWVKKEEWVDILDELIIGSEINGKIEYRDSCLYGKIRNG
ncbi:MAG: DUF2971 domain-containing protein [Clostridia bacterium]|nr:DUF2971 domain-containing protein [Clostridia bacterium]